MAPHSSTLAWKIPWREEPGRLQSRGSLKSQTWLSDFTFIFHFNALEKEMATHSSVLAWRIPGTGEPGGLPSMGSHRVGHDWSDLAAAAAAAWCLQRLMTISRLPRCLSVKNLLGLTSRRTGFHPWAGEVGNGHPLQCSCLLESHGRRSLVGYSPTLGCRELDMTWQLNDNNNDYFRNKTCMNKLRWMWG